MDPLAATSRQPDRRILAALDDRPRPGCKPSLALWVQVQVQALSVRILG